VGGDEEKRHRRGKNNRPQTGRDRPSPVASHSHNSKNFETRTPDLYATHCSSVRTSGCGCGCTAFQVSTAAYIYIAHAAMPVHYGVLITLPSASAL
jgi:hypothetical protein